ncbi:hypothetical protein [Actinoplanes sp. NPDC051494]|uniref:LexA family protein n=1 Tax=Actinoplanes sp. NPDC051494 TaxID=3363907 RepID=UPI00378817EA
MTAAVVPLLTLRQRRILDFIRSYFAEHQYPPSQRDIAVAVGFASQSAVAYQLGELQRMGWIRRTPGVSRGLVVLDPATGGP